MSVFLRTFLLMCGLGVAFAQHSDLNAIPGRLILQKKKDISAERATFAMRMRGAAVKHAHSASGYYLVEIPADQTEAVEQSLLSSGEFTVVEHDYYAHVEGTPNDSLYSSQWYLPKIQAPDAWNIGTGSNVIIAIVDSGVDATHPDLAAKIVPGWNFVANTSNTSDLTGHGTAVAGAAAAVGNNNQGIAGVALNSSIMPIVAVDANSVASYYNIAMGIRYAVDHGARVINASVGGTSMSTTLQSAVDYAVSNNVVFIASAMNNSSSTPAYPAACKGAVSVSATTETDTLAGFSNYGSWIIVSAPGNNILTTSRGGGYAYWEGTSFSSPITAGVVALMRSVNPGLTGQQAVSILEQTADDLGTPGFDINFGYGRVNALKAVTASAPLSISVSPAPVTLWPSQAQQFAAKITGTTSAPVWSVSPNIGTVTAAGLYTAPSAITSNQTITLTATVAGISSNALINLTPPAASISISPTPVSLAPSQSQQFTATLKNTTGTVSWSIYPLVGSISAAGLYTAPSSITVNQPVTVTASVSGISSTAAVNLIAPTASGSGATFIQTDTTTQGNWKSAYGTEGDSVIGDLSSAPLYATATAAGQAQWTWAASTSDQRALQKQSNTNDRIAATWYQGASFTIDVNCVDTLQHQLSLYSVDWDGYTRQQRFDVLDAATGAVIDTRTLANFHNGAYLVWSIKGHVKVRVTNVAGANAVVSGIFFGSAAVQTQLASPVSFVRLDAATEGSWSGSYGADGYTVINDSSVMPSYATVTPVSQSNYTWAAATADIRALQKGSNLSSRLAATWYSATSFTLDVNITGTTARQLALYCVDWDKIGRNQRIDVINPATGAIIDSRSLANFQNGVYVVWNLVGHVQFRITNTGFANAVVSGIFFR